MWNIKLHLQAFEREKYVINIKKKKIRNCVTQEEYTIIMLYILCVPTFYSKLCLQAQKKKNTPPKLI